MFMLMLTHKAKSAYGDVIKSNEFYYLQSIDKGVAKKVYGADIINGVHNNTLDIKNLTWDGKNLVVGSYFYLNCMFNPKGKEGCILVLGSSLWIYAGGRNFVLPLDSMCSLALCFVGNKGFVLDEISIDGFSTTFGRIRLEFLYENMTPIWLGELQMEGAPCDKASFIRHIGMYGR